MSFSHRQHPELATAKPGHPCKCGHAISRLAWDDGARLCSVCKQRADEEAAEAWLETPKGRRIDAAWEQRNQREGQMATQEQVSSKELELKIEAAEKLLEEERTALAPFPADYDSRGKPIARCPKCGAIIRQVQYKSGEKPGMKTEAFTGGYLGGAWSYRLMGDIFAAPAQEASPAKRADHFYGGRVEHLEWPCQCGYKLLTAVRRGE